VVELKRHRRGSNGDPSCQRVSLQGSLTGLGLLALEEERMKRGIALEWEGTFFYCSFHAPWFSRWVNLGGITGQTDEGKNNC